MANAKGEVLSAIIDCSRGAWWYPGEGVVKSIKRQRAYPPGRPEGHGRNTRCARNSLRSRTRQQIASRPAIAALISTLTLRRNATAGVAWMWYPPGLLGRPPLTHATSAV